MMPAIGQESGRTYDEKEILVEPTYRLMADEVLFRIESGVETDVQVRPVRNETSPNFRKLRDAALKLPVEARETDPTHEGCIDALVALLKTSKLKVWSPTFDDDGKRDPFGQVIFAQGSSNYSWWRDGGACRMPAGERRYIQPDICGRSSDLFFASARQQNVIIEVINTHAPELATFYSLLEYSKFNHLVVFYYVAAGVDGSQYSRHDSLGGMLTMQVAHYLLGGCVYRNGREVERGRRSEEQWYTHLMETYFGTPINDKRPQSYTRPIAL